MENKKNFERKNFSLDAQTLKILEDLSETYNLNKSQTISFCLSFTKKYLLDTERLDKVFQQK